MSDDNFIVVDKRLSYKLVELGYWASLIKIEGENYYFEPLDEIKETIALYSINESVTSNTPADAEPIHDKPTVIIEPKAEKHPMLVKSGRIHKMLTERGFELLYAKTNPSNGRIEYYFDYTAELQKAFSEILIELQRRDNEVFIKVSANALTADDRQILYKIVKLKYDECLTMGVKDADIYNKLNDLMDKLNTNNG